MITYLDLYGNWEMKNTKETEWSSATIPGSMYSNLLEQGKIENPFYRDNELAARELSKEDYAFRRSFVVEAAFLEKENIMLRLEGIDTLATISINGVVCGETHNMHRTWEFQVKEFLKIGENCIHIQFHSPIEYITQKGENQFLWGVSDAIEGYPHLRKAHYMFGWDWGPQLPDMGIWRPIQLVGFHTARLDEVYVVQTHREDRVDLAIKVTTKDVVDRKGLVAEVIVTSPVGEAFTVEQPVEKEINQLNLSITSPAIWWPHGYGEQPLYTVHTILKKGGEVLEERSFSIGLRTLKVSTAKDKWGEEFCFVVNGEKIFSMGADYIPEDNILSRMSKEKTEKLIQDCVAANHNTIRVWGGGYYLDDYFYDLCDAYGLIVWQDFMYACGVYNLDTAFEENIKAETKDNILRLRHHASLGIWCGNNEMELAWVEWDMPKSEKLRLDYIRQFEVVIKELCATYDPETFYWPASPSSGGGFINPNDENRGDVHYWEVWHGNKPFEEYRKYYFRYCSEFGFESLPEMETLDTVLIEEDKNLFSYVMELHQKCASGNTKILSYLANQYQYPKDFESLIYTSQILQADAIRYGVEHWRRHRGRCMGAIYWQLNDCWPGSSWASIDYYGRWKALHYASKRFFAPVMISAHDEGYEVVLNVTNETRKVTQGEVIWKLCDRQFGVVAEGVESVHIDALASKDIATLNLNPYFKTIEAKRNQVLTYVYKVNDEIVSTGSLLFTKPKHFEFKKPNYQLEVVETDTAFRIHLQADTYTKSVKVKVKGEDLVFSDNYFDIVSSEGKWIQFEKVQLKGQYTADELIEKISLMDIYQVSH